MNDSRFKVIFEKSPVGYAYHELVRDSDGKLIDYMLVEANAAFDRITGLKAAEMIGRKESSLREECKRAGIDWISLYSKALKCEAGENTKSAENDESGENRAPLPLFSALSGRWFTVEVCELDICGPGNDCVLSSFTDITSSMKADSILHESKSLYQTILDSTAEAIFGIDTQGNCLFCNKSFLQMARYSSMESILGKNIHEVIHHNNCDGFPFPLEKCRIFNSFKNGTGLHVNDEPLWRADGTSFPVEFWSYPLMKDSVVTGAVITFIDISERKQMEDKLMESEVNFRTFFETLDDLVFVADPDGKILHVNSAVLRKLGYTKDEIEGKQLLDMHPSKLRLEAEQFFGEMLAMTRSSSSIPLESKYCGLVPAETRTWMGTWNGKESIFCVSKDISQEQAALQKFNKIFESNPALMIIASETDGKIIDVNKAFVEKTGYKREEALGKTVREFDLLCSHEEMLRYGSDVRKSGRIVNREMQLKTKAGEILDGLFSGEIMENQGSRFLLTIMIDITEQKRAEKILKDTDERLSLAIRAGSVGIWEMNTVSGQLIWDDQMFTLYGVSKDTFCGAYEAWTSALHPEDIARGNEEVEAVIRGEKDFDTEFRVVWPDGSIHYIRALAKGLRDKSGKVVRLIGTNWDISLQKNTEAKLQSEIIRANELKIQADAANDAKSNFLSMMSHEIRTPMNGVIGMTNLLLDTGLTEEQREYAGIIQSSGESLLSIINDILDFSKIEAGKIELEKIDFHLRLTLEDSVNILELKAREKNLKLVSVIDPDVPVHLRGDPGRLRQILINLVGNAIKFTSEGGVTIRTSLETEDDKTVIVRIAVTDTGIGIPPDKQEQLFSRFTQVDSSTSRKFGGTGLGLSIAKQLALLMGGTIGLTSAEGSGSTFWFTAVFEKREAGQLIPGENYRNLSDMYVLVLDSDDANRFLVSSLLAGWGCRFRETSNVTVALAILSSEALVGNPFSAALMDVKTLLADEASLSLLMKEKEMPCLTRFILMISPDSRASIARFANSGFSGNLMKPISESDLRRTLSNLGGLEQNPSFAKMPGATFSKSRILLAEDNATNQLVIRKMLEKLRYNADIASDGREAIDALLRIHYDLVLMDCQMPVMDGYAATRMIRENETGERHIPIIAMTANALQGDREKCIEAGMDDYISKPIDLRLLSSLLAKWIPHPDDDLEMLEVAMVTDIPQTLPVFDRASFMSRISNDGEFARQIIETFLEDVPLQLEALARAIDAGSVDKAANFAHRMKGASANLGCEALRETAGDMEAAGRAGDMDAVRELFPDLQKKFEDVRQALS